MLNYILASAIIALVIGFIIGSIYENRKLTSKYDGEIWLGKSEDGNDRITFYLGMEYDDIAEHSSIIFKVNKMNVVK